MSEVEEMGFTRVVEQSFGARWVVRSSYGRGKTEDHSETNHITNHTRLYTDASRFSNSTGHDSNTALSFLEMAHPMPSNGPCPSFRPL